MKPRITNAEELAVEKKRLKLAAEKHRAILGDDIEYIKEEYGPVELLNKAAATIVPEMIRHSPMVNDPVNYIAKNFFNERRDVVDENSDKGKGNRIRNIALGVAETIGTYLLSRYLRRKV